MHVDRRTRQIEVEEVTLGGLREKQVEALKLAVTDALGERCKGDYLYEELIELRDALKALDEEERDYWR